MTLERVKSPDKQSNDLFHSKRVTALSPVPVAPNTWSTQLSTELQPFDTVNVEQVFLRACLKRHRNSSSCVEGEVEGGYEAEAGVVAPELKNTGPTPVVTRAISRVSDRAQRNRDGMLPSPEGARQAARERMSTSGLKQALLTREREIVRPPGRAFEGSGRSSQLQFKGRIARPTGSDTLRERYSRPRPENGLVGPTGSDIRLFGRNSRPQLARLVTKRVYRSDASTLLSPLQQWAHILGCTLRAPAATVEATYIGLFVFPNQDDTDGGNGGRVTV